MLRRTKSIGLVFFMCTALVLVPSSFAQEDDAKDLPTPQSITAEDMPSLDITNTDEGQRQAAEAIKRWSTEYGMKIRPDEVTVLNLGTAEEPDILVTSNSNIFESASTTVAPDGTVTVDMQVSTAAAPPDSAISEEPIGTQSQSWNMVAQDCDWFDGDTAEIHHCYKVYKLEGDASSRDDYYQLENFSTTQSKWPWQLLSATVEGVRDPQQSASMEWVDWNPRADLDVNTCDTIELGISHGPATIAASHQICERWDITKYGEAGKFSNRWHGNSHQQAREVAYTNEVSVLEGGWPVWNLDYSYRAH
ncbi:MAG: hypothetical protein GFH27_549289n92 [Chloroflexi bacterium AL-W]|nr:hypothetical protein [Chloroflexi bacterium AL-N1]NOK66824.1 hypothetical protein [Chloroflexi bacterium AL-N10]NOK74884.1 hypothetical protein [Chloroflexi bacterium AL-N5]NOK81427.1 hypothetical protein [Chloroflexi bacterium AL-W]NOK88896.1 hypothetical protein [Chloroflexi bacterium AL-N15]